MSAYLINYACIPDGIPRPEVLAQVRRTVEAYGRRWHLHWEERAFAAARVNSAALVEFGSMKDAQNWYNSCDYKKISHLYADTAIDLVLADGVSPDFTMAGFA